MLAPISWKSLFYCNLSHLCHLVPFTFKLTGSGMEAPKLNFNTSELNSSWWNSGNLTWLSFNPSIKDAMHTDQTIRIAFSEESAAFSPQRECALPKGQIEHSPQTHTNNHFHWKGLFPWQPINKTLSFNGTLSFHQGAIWKSLQLAASITLPYREHYNAFIPLYLYLT